MSSSISVVFDSVSQQRNILAPARPPIMTSSVDMETKAGDTEIERSARDIKNFVRRKIDRLYEKLLEQNTNAKHPPDSKSGLLALHNWNVLNEKVDALHTKLDQMRHEQAPDTSEIIMNLAQNVEKIQQHIRERIESNDVSTNTNSVRAPNDPPPIIVEQGSNSTSDSPSISIPDEWSCSQCTFKNPIIAEICEGCEGARVPMPSDESDPENTESTETGQFETFDPNTNENPTPTAPTSTINTNLISNPESQSGGVYDSSCPQTPGPVTSDLVDTSSFPSHDSHQQFNELHLQEITWCRGFFQKVINSKVIKLERMAYHTDLAPHIFLAWIKGLDSSLMVINDIESNGTLSIHEEMKRLVIEIFQQFPDGLLMVDLWKKITDNISADVQTTKQALSQVLTQIAKKVVVEQQNHYILDDKVQYVFMSKIKSLLIDIRKRLESVLRGDCCEKKHSERIKHKAKELLKEFKSASKFHHQRAKAFSQSPERRHSLIKASTCTLSRMTDTTDCISNFRSWLTNTVKLPQCIANFENHGFEDMLVISKITKEDLSAIGVDKIGHQRVILMHVRRHRNNDNRVDPEVERSSNMNAFNLYESAIKQVIGCFVPQSPERRLNHYHSKCDKLRECVESGYLDSGSDQSDSESDNESDAEFIPSNSYWLEEPENHKIYLESIMEFIKLNKRKKSKSNDQYVPIVDSSSVLYQRKVSRFRQSKVMEVYEIEDHNRSTYLNRSTGLRSKMCIPEGTVIGEYITKYVLETDLDTLQGTHLHQRINEYAFSSQEIEVEMTLEQIQYYQDTKGLDDDEDMLVEPPLKKRKLNHNLNVHRNEKRNVNRNVNRNLNHDVNAVVDESDSDSDEDMIRSHSQRRRRSERLRKLRSMTHSFRIVPDGYSVDEKAMLYFINDCRQNVTVSERTAQDEVAQNVLFVTVFCKGWPRIFAVATEDIEEGTELLSYYGDFGDVIQQTNHLKERDDRLREILNPIGMSDIVQNLK